MKKRILIIEDEAPVASYLVLFLREAGYEVEKSDTLEAGRKRILEERFDLVLLDIMLPDGTADELLPFIRERLPKLPVLLVTGLAADDALLINCLKAGANGCVSKTSRVDQLLFGIRRALGE